MTETVEKIVAKMERQFPPRRFPDLAVLIADWRARGEEIKALRLRQGICYSGVDVANAAEAMRAKCEAIARAMANDGSVYDSGSAWLIADAIAALKAP